MTRDVQPEPTAVFADTAFFVAIMSRRDSLHAAALSWAERPGVSIVTSEYVLIELANFLARSGQKRAVASLFTSDASQALRLLPATKQTLNEAIALYTKHDDKHWSLTDCTSMVLMRRRRLRDVLTADHHFRQAGFRTLL